MNHITPLYYILHYYFINNKTIIYYNNKIFSKILTIYFKYLRNYEKIDKDNNCIGSIMFVESKFEEFDFENLQKYDIINRLLLGYNLLDINYEKNIFDKIDIYIQNTLINFYYKIIIKHLMVFIILCIIVRD